MRPRGALSRRRPRIRTAPAGMEGRSRGSRGPPGGPTASRRGRGRPGGEGGQREGGGGGRRGRPRARGGWEGRPRRPARPLTTATLATGRGAEAWKAARGDCAAPPNGSARRPGRGAKAAVTASLDATRARRAAILREDIGVAGSRSAEPRLRTAAARPRARRWAGPRLRSRPWLALNPARARGSAAGPRGFGHRPRPAPRRRRREARRVAVAEKRCAEMRGLELTCVVMRPQRDSATPSGRCPSVQFSSAPPFPGR